MKGFEWDDDDISYDEASLEGEDEIEAIETLPSLASFHSQTPTEKTSNTCTICFTNIFRFCFGSILLLYATNCLNIDTKISDNLNHVLVTTNLTSDFKLYLHPAFTTLFAVFYLLISGLSTLSLVCSTRCWKFSRKFEILFLIMTLFANLFYQQKLVLGNNIQQAQAFYNGNFTETIVELLKTGEACDNLEIRMIDDVRMSPPRFDRPTNRLFNQNCYHLDAYVNITDGEKLFPHYDSTCNRNTSGTNFVFLNHFRDGACGIDTIVFLVVLTIFVKCWHFGCYRKRNSIGTGGSSSISDEFESNVKSFQNKITEERTGIDAWAEEKPSTESMRARRKAELQRVGKRQSDSFSKHISRKSQQSANKRTTKFR